MSVRAHLKPFPAAAAHSVGVGFADIADVNDLKYLAWIVKKYTLSFAIFFDDGTGALAVPIPDVTVEMGTSAGAALPAFATQKEILDYRATNYTGTGTYGSNGYAYTLNLGAAMFYGPVRDGGGALITSGGDYEYQVNLFVDVTTPGASGRLSTNPSDGIATFLASCDLAGFNIPMFDDSPTTGSEFTGTITFTVLEEW